jgi:GNAT superfamily N-acetyltransferase
VRRLGIATRLLGTAETRAIELGRTLLLLDTVTGSPAERLYSGLGWQHLGSVPGYALNVDGVPEAATFMWKRLTGGHSAAG